MSTDGEVTWVPLEVPDIEVGRVTTVVAGGRAHTSDGKTTRSRRTLALDRHTADVLARHLKDGEVWMDGAFWLVTAKRA